MSYGIQSQAELSEYYCEFIQITDYITKYRLLEHKRNIAYVSGFQEEFWTHIITHLQYLIPTHYHDDSYKLKTFHLFCGPLLRMA
jgi:hypothetical protein